MARDGSWWTVEIKLHFQFFFDVEWTLSKIVSQSSETRSIIPGSDNLNSCRACEPFSVQEVAIAKAVLSFMRWTVA